VADLNYCLRSALGAHGISDRWRNADLALVVDWLPAPEAGLDDLPEITELRAAHRAARAEWREAEDALRAAEDAVSNLRQAGAPSGDLRDAENAVMDARSKLDGARRDFADVAAAGFARAAQLADEWAAAPRLRARAAEVDEQLRTLIAEQSALSLTLAAHDRWIGGLRGDAWVQAHDVVTRSVAAQREILERSQTVGLSLGAGQLQRPTVPTTTVRAA
jgi:hypothetical protein